MNTEIKTALVTGGSRGIGQKIVTRLIEEGYFVHFTYLCAKEKANGLEQKFAGMCKAAAIDGSDSKQVERFINGILAEQAIDVLVNNAGISSEALVQKETWDNFNRVMQCNLGGVFNFSRAVLRGMMQTKSGDIVTISSQAAENIRYGNSAYGTSKAAINRFNAGLAKEAARFNVAANVIAPSFVETDMTQSLLSGEQRRRLLKEIPTRRFVRVSEVVNAVMFFISREVPLYGVVLPVGGGTHL